MNHQIILFTFVVAFSVASAIVYLLSLIIDWNGNNDMLLSLSRHSIGIFVVIATALSMYLFFATTFSNSIEFPGYPILLLVFLMGSITTSAVIYLLSLTIDWGGTDTMLSSLLRPSMGILAIVSTVLSLYLFFTKILILP